MPRRVAIDRSPWRWALVAIGLIFAGLSLPDVFQPVPGYAEHDHFELFMFYAVPMVITAFGLGLTWVALRSGVFADRGGLVIRPIAGLRTKRVPLGSVRAVTVIPVDGPGPASISLALVDNEGHVVDLPLAAYDTPAGRRRAHARALTMSTVLGVPLAADEVGSRDHAPFAGESLSSHVTWTATPVPRWRRVVGWLPTIVGALIALGLSLDGPPLMTTLSGPSTSDPLMPASADGSLGTVTVWGRGAGLPAAFPTKHVASLYADRATIRPGLTTTILPLKTLQLQSARRRGPHWRRRKAYDARWELHLTGPETDLTMVGPWLLLAHLGTLAAWDEPA